MLQSKHVIITGGARGIGFALAQELTSKGTKVIICSRTKPEIEKALTNLNKDSLVAYGIVCDISKLNDCKRLIAFAKKKLNFINILINNAGTLGEVGELETNNLQKWVNTIKTNLFGTVYCTKLIIPLMKKVGGGKIINFAGGGVGSKKAMPNFSAYYTSKIAIAGFTETTALELKKWNININCISPGLVNTKMVDYLISQGPAKTGLETYERFLGQKNANRNSPKMVVKMISFLCSDQSDHLTGKLISAKWDNIKTLKNLSNNNDYMFKLRRIDGILFNEC